MNNNSKSQTSNFFLYATPDGKVHVEVFFKNETVWLTQKRMAELFECSSDNISLHLKNIFSDGELEKTSVIEESSTTASDGKTYNTMFYNLDAIIAVGYRVNSKKATQFRIWATRTLKEYIIKGFAMDDERLKNGSHFEKDYFQELLERVRSIRASERRIYLKITDIFQECSIDYDPHSQITKDFFAIIQNKFHFAITGQTAAEIIYDSANRTKPYMGLKTWKNAPGGRILSYDVTTAKNYLSERDIKKLERTISGFFDYIENVIENRNIFTMSQFTESVDKFLNFNEYQILINKGSISAESAKKKALAEYEEFNKRQHIGSDFERKLIEYLRAQHDDDN